jgi:hypothetical protein
VTQSFPVWCKIILHLNQNSARSGMAEWVDRIASTVGRPLPVYPGQRTSSHRPDMSGWCQSTKSLRSSPRRGGKSRGAGSRLRGQR